MKLSPAGTWVKAGKARCRTSGAKSSGVPRQRVEANYRVDGVKRTQTQRLYLIKDGFGDTADHGKRNLEAIELFQTAAGCRALYRCNRRVTCGRTSLTLAAGDIRVPVPLLKLLGASSLAALV